jgi:hypothetical protein
VQDRTDGQDLAVGQFGQYEVGGGNDVRGVPAVAEADVGAVEHEQHASLERLDRVKG